MEETSRPHQAGRGRFWLLVPPWLLQEPVLHLWVVPINQPPVLTQLKVRSAPADQLFLDKVMKLSTPSNDHGGTFPVSMLDTLWLPQVLAAGFSLLSVSHQPATSQPLRSRVRIRLETPHWSGSVTLAGRL